MGLRERLKKWCPNPQKPITTTMRRYSAPITVLVAATILVVSFSVISSAYFFSKPSLPPVNPNAIIPTAAPTTAPTPTTVPSDSQATSSPSPSPTPTQTIAAPTPTQTPVPVQTPPPIPSFFVTQPPTQTAEVTPQIQSQLVVLSVNYTTSGTTLLQCLIHALISGVTVENVGNQTVCVTSVRLYYGAVGGELQKARDVQVYVPPYSTADIDVKMAPTEVSSQGGPSWVVAVVTSDGAVASSASLPLCGDPLPPMN